MECEARIVLMSRIRRMCMDDLDLTKPMYRCNSITSVLKRHTISPIAVSDAIGSASQGNKPRNIGLSGILAGSQFSSAGIALLICLGDLRQDAQFTQWGRPEGR